MAAVMTAALADNQPPAWLLPCPWVLRWLEGALNGVVSMFAGWLFHLLLADIGRPQSAMPALHSTLMITGCIGFVIGTIVPTWYRRAVAGSSNPMGIDRGSTQPSDSADRRSILLQRRAASYAVLVGKTSLLHVNAHFNDRFRAAQVRITK
ncbi:MAG: hypothetical protein ACREJU_17215 [Nitrospiraceae bacterium]